MIKKIQKSLVLVLILQINAEYQVATPVNWKSGDDVVIPPTVSDEEAIKKYPEGYKTLKPYLRLVKSPKR